MKVEDLTRVLRVLSERCPDQGVVDVVVNFKDGKKLSSVKAVDVIDNTTIMITPEGVEIRPPKAAPAPEKKGGKT